MRRQRLWSVEAELQPCGWRYARRWKRWQRKLEEEQARREGGQRRRMEEQSGGRRQRDLEE
jgi:hypothetical protein